MSSPAAFGSSDLQGSFLFYPDLVLKLMLDADALFSKFHATTTRCNAWQEETVTVPRPDSTKDHVISGAMPADATSSTASACARALPGAPPELYTVKREMRDNGSSVWRVFVTQEGLKPEHWETTLRRLLNDPELRARHQVDVLREEGEFSEDETADIVAAFQLQTGQLLVGAIAVQVGHRARNGSYTVRVRDVGVPKIGAHITS